MASSKFEQSPRKKILLIDDEALVREVLGGILEELEYEVITAADGEEGLELFKAAQPDLVITDMRMPRRDGLSVAMAIRKAAPYVPVTVITGHGSEEMVIDALRAGVTDFVKKPVRLEDLRAVLSRMEAALWATPQAGQPASLPAAMELVGLKYTYLMHNDLEAIPTVVEHLLDRSAPGLGRKGAAELSLALRELLINAVEHGNLDITFSEKTEALEHGTMEQLLARRLEDPRLRGRRVSVSTHYQEGELTVSISDQGEGFDPRKMPDPLDPHQELSVNGRGLLLARLSVDSMVHTPPGNRVTVTKRI